MLRTYLKTSLRSLLKNKTYTFINVLGLSIGLTCAIVIFFIIKFETSFDSHHQDGDRIYRLLTEVQRGDDLVQSQSVPVPMPEALLEEFAEIEQVSIISSRYKDPVFSYEENGQEKRHLVEKNAFVAPAYFDILSYQWIYGSQHTALSQPFSVALAESVATALFGNQDPMGKTVDFDKRFQFTVTGVYADPPANSDFQFRALISFGVLDAQKSESWYSTYSSMGGLLKLKEKVNPDDVEYRFQQFLQKHMTEEEAAKRRMYLEPLQDMHFNTATFNYNRTISRQSLLTLTAIGVFIVLAACINFVNLNTVLVFKRAREVGIKKVLGGSRFGVALQFLSETFFITISAFLVSFGFLEVILLNLDQLLGFHVETKVFDPLFLQFSTVIIAGTTLLAGFYPAFLLTRFNPSEALKAKIYDPDSGKKTFRRSLVVFQFALTQLLIVGTIVASRQLDHFYNFPLGINPEAVVEVPVFGGEEGQLQTFKSRLVAESSVKSVSLSNTGTIGSYIWDDNFKYRSDEEEMEGYAHLKLVDEDYLETYGIELVAGSFNPPTDENANTQFLVNESFLKSVGKSADEVIGNSLATRFRQGLITGVVKDFNTASLHEEIQPVIILNSAVYQWAAVKLQEGSDLQTAIGKIEDAWSGMYPHYIFTYRFLDDKIAGLYQEEARVTSVFTWFAGLAIFIGCLGLYGLVSFMASQKTKEVGIRKVLGAAVHQILLLFSREFTVLILAAFIIAAPVAYYLMNGWLSNFAYRISLSAGIFVTAFAVSLALSLLTVGYKSLKAATANPVDALRDE